MKFPLTTSQFSRNRAELSILRNYLAMAFSYMLPQWPLIILEQSFGINLKRSQFFNLFPVCFRLIYSRKVVWPQPDGASGFSMVIQATLVLLVHWYSSISVPKRKLPSIQSRLRTKKGHDWLHGGFLFGIEIGGYQ